VEFRLLGPLEVRTGDHPVDLGTTKQRVVLAVLLNDVGTPVAVDTLIDRVWEDDPPAGARNVLYAHLSRIRRLLTEAGTGAHLVRGPAGYALLVEPDLVDQHRFRTLVERARAAGLPAARRGDLLAEALAVWHGEPLSGLPGRWVLRLREALVRQRLDAAVAWAQVELRLGRHAALIDALRVLVAEHPIVEPLTAVLMQALHAAGRGAEALDCYQQTRRRLVEELGADPGRDLREVYQRILRGDRPAPVPPRAGPARARPVLDGPTVPAQLPLDGSGFTGRAGYLRRLDALLPAGDAPAGTAVTIAAIVGTAGVGKSTLALHWAHRIAARYPDGQLYLNLRGFDPRGAVMPAAEAVRWLLDALSVPPGRVPYGLDAQAALYRSLLADKRVLVVLDNARDAEQVRPLLPGSPGCLVVVTSRNQLPSLVAAQGAHPLTLDVPGTDETLDLLAARVGAVRVRAEPQAARDIVDRCARLPLAVAIVAARAATHPDFPLSDLAADLGGHGVRLDAFAAGDPATDVRAVFSWSCATLSPPAARLFRLLGLHPGPDVGPAAVASLAAVTPARAGQLLAQLAGAHLVTQPDPGRYALHDLLRAYAIELAGGPDAPGRRRAATGRLLDHYLHTGHAAALRLNPQREPLVLPVARAGVRPEPIADRAGALAWFAAQRPVLLAAIALAAGTGADTHAWQLAWTLTTYFDRRGSWHDWVGTQQQALAATQRLGDPVAQAHVHRGLGLACARLGQDDEAFRHYRHALALYRRLGDPVGQAHTHNNLGWLSGRHGRHRTALRHARCALDLYRQAGHQVGQAGALNAIGWYHGLLGDHRAALGHCQRALGVLQEIGDGRGEAATWDSLGHAHHHLGDHAQAQACYHRALELFREAGDRHNEAATLIHLGDAYLAAGQPGRTRQAWLGAAEIFDELGHAGAQEVRLRLAGLDATTAVPAAVLAVPAR